MVRSLDRDKLLAAFDEIGRAAIAANTWLTIAVYGGSALMLASNFRFTTEDVDMAEIGQPWPEWLANAVERIAADADKQRFVLRRILSSPDTGDAPSYPQTSD